MRDTDYTESLPEVATMAFAPLRAFGHLMEECNHKEISIPPIWAGKVTLALVDYAERRFADALAMVESSVGRISVGFDGDACSIADKVVDAELTPAPKKQKRGADVVLLAPAGDGEDAHHG